MIDFLKDKDLKIVPNDTIGLNHLMVDIETLGRRDGVIIQIAAGFFNPETCEMGEYVFNEYVTPQSCIELGGQIDPDTVMWWMKQSDEARKSITDPYYNHKGTAIYHVLELLSEYIATQMIKQNDPNYDSLRVWGNSPIFDMDKIEFYYEKTGITKPWEYHQVIDLRTAEVQLKKFKYVREKVGVPHDAFWDIKMQIVRAVNWFLLTKELEKSMQNTTRIIPVVPKEELSHENIV